MKVTSSVILVQVSCRKPFSLVLNVGLCLTFSDETQKRDGVTGLDQMIVSLKTSVNVLFYWLTTSSDMIIKVEIDNLSFWSEYWLHSECNGCRLVLLCCSVDTTLHFSQKNEGWIQGHRSNKTGRPARINLISRVAKLFLKLFMQSLRAFKQPVESAFQYLTDTKRKDKWL